MINRCIRKTIPSDAIVCYITNVYDKYFYMSKLVLRFVLLKITETVRVKNEPVDRFYRFFYGNFRFVFNYA